MSEAAAVSALGLTVFLVLRRPTIAHRIVVGPALAASTGVIVMVLAGHVSPADVAGAAAILWQPLVAITSIMLTAAAAYHLGVLDRLALSSLRHADGSVHQLFLRVFVLSAITAAALNNDSAILILTPLVVVLIRRMYPDHPAILVPFVFAVFMAAGVAPLVTSNPMNLIVADFAGLDFNAYALSMAPVAVTGWVVTFAAIRLLFRRTLAQVAATAAAALPHGPAEWSAPQRHGLLLLVSVLGAYPVASAFGIEVWPVAVAGAVAATLLCRHHRATTLRALLRSGVSWEILVFLLGVFTIAIGLRNAGAVDWLVDVYANAGYGVVGVVSAIGSALINNHSMALTNLMAIEAISPAGETAYLAALVGGDLGPRLLPMGSLAGLLWFVTLQRMDVDVSVARFVVVGTIVTIPTLAVSLLMLGLVT